MNVTHDYLSIVAYLRLRNGKAVRAIRILKALLVLEPENGWARRALAYAYLSDGQYEQCLAEIDHRLWPASAVHHAHVIRTRSLWGLGRHDEARQVVRQMNGNLRGEHGN
ncbi:MAG: tetratricopeptide repeat protein [Pirellulales bacterium]|nr:tetratricopeptide repeat protein [Pirellulales bacterium]